MVGEQLNMEQTTRELRLPILMEEIQMKHKTGSYVVTLEDGDERTLIDIVSDYNVAVGVAYDLANTLVAYEFEGAKDAEISRMYDINGDRGFFITVSQRRDEIRIYVYEQINEEDDKE